MPRNIPPPVPNPENTPAITVPQAGAYLGLSRAGSYAAARRGDLPVIRVGNRNLMVSTAKLRELLGLDTFAGAA